MSDSACSLQSTTGPGVPWENLEMEGKSELVASTNLGNGGKI
jgi:hypothetical protein